MAIIMLAELRGATTEQYDQVNERLGIRGDEDAPDGLLSHVAGPTDDGMLVVDVWESEEAFGEFFGGGAGPALAEVGIPAPEPRVVPLHNRIPKGRGDEAGVIMVAEIQGVSTDAYDRMTATMDAHAGDGSNHPAVLHVVGVSEDGLVAVDVWDSPESFARFAEEEIAPAGAAVGLPGIEPRFVPVHRLLTPNR